MLLHVLSVAITYNSSASCRSLGSLATLWSIAAGALRSLSTNGFFFSFSFVDNLLAWHGCLFVLGILSLHFSIAQGWQLSFGLSWHTVSFR